MQRDLELRPILAGLSMKFGLKRSLLALEVLVKPRCTEGLERESTGSLSWQRLGFAVLGYPHTAFSFAYNIPTKRDPAVASDCPWVLLR